MDTLLRQWNMLRMIPRYPRKIDTATIEQRLDELGYGTTRRTIQRDLLALSKPFPISCDDNKPAGWFWQEAAGIFDIPGFDPRVALTFQMVSDFLSRMLPSSCVEYIQPHVNQAESVLSEMKSPGLGGWSNKVAVVSRNQPLLPPAIGTDVLSVVYDALLYGRQIEVRYRKRLAGKAQEYVANPLGVVFADNVIYLVCTLFDYDDVILLTLHRMEVAAVLESTVCVPEGFDLQGYIAGGGLGFGKRGQQIRLKALLDEEVAFHLGETQLSEDQTLSPPNKDGRVKLEATVQDTAQLRWWLLGFGAQVEVTGPTELRQEMASISTDMARLYKN